MELPTKVHNSLGLVLAYCSDEYEDYYRESLQRNYQDGERHIYEDIALVREWLASPHLSIEELERATNQHLEELRQEAEENRVAWESQQEGATLTA
jgi:hypothetical protein